MAPAWTRGSVLLGPALACAGLLGACGASSHDTVGAGTSASRADGTSVSTSRDTVTEGTVTHRPFDNTGGASANDDNPAGNEAGKGNGSSTQGSPCRLVSKAQAQKILGKTIDAPQDAPLGPTCIYQPTGGGNAITLAIEPMEDPHAVASSLRKPVHFELAGHSAYCSRSGQPTTLVALDGNGVLSIAAPCPIGRQFAAAALASGVVR